VPEENFWTLWCKGILTEADTPTIRLGATPSRLSSAHLHHLPIFLQAGCPSCRQTNSVKALKAINNNDNDNDNDNNIIAKMSSVFLNCWISIRHSANIQTAVQILKEISDRAKLTSFELSQCFETVGRGDNKGIWPVKKTAPIIPQRRLVKQTRISCH